MSTIYEVAPKVVRYWKQIQWKKLLFDFLLLPCMALVYWTVNAQGLRTINHAFATKLYKVPGAVILGLGRWRIWHELDIAPFFALILLTFVFLSTTNALRILLFGVPQHFANREVHTPIIFAGAVALIVFDMTVFYKGLVDSMFFERGIQFVPLLMTLGYSVVLAYAAYCRSFMDMLARGRNFAAWSEHPVLEKYTKLAIRLAQNQDVWTSQSLLPGALIPKSDIWLHYIDHCTDPQLRMELTRLMAMSARDQLTLLEPGKRLLEQFLSSPPIVARTSRPATFNRQQFLNDGGIFVILGGNVSDEALRVLVGADFQETCFLAKKGLLCPGYFVIDK
jgi:hypothetical protein